jgi:CHASE1-domain containing sensor protein
MKKDVDKPVVASIVLLVILLLTLAGFGLAQKNEPAKPVITVEKLQKRLSDLEAAKIQALANLNAINGAIEDCKYWIGELEGTSEEDATD